MVFLIDGVVDGLDKSATISYVVTSNNNSIDIEYNQRDIDLAFSRWSIYTTLIRYF